MNDDQTTAEALRQAFADDDKPPGLVAGDIVAAALEGDQHAARELVTASALLAAVARRRIDEGAADGELATLRPLALELVASAAGAMRAIAEREALADLP